jgi:hypothetical protein
MKLALNIPQYGTIQPFPGLKPQLSNAKLGDLITQGLEIVIYIVLFLAFFWFVWGAFQYIIAGGKKEELAKARSRIIWAIVGLLVTLLAYTLTRFAAEIFPPTTGGLPF